MLQKISAQRVKVTLAVVFTLSLCCSGCSSKNAENGTQATPASLPKQNTAASASDKSAATSNRSVAQKSTPVMLAAQQRGEKVFTKAYCIGCHAGGSNAMMPDRPIKGEAFRKKYKDDAILEKTIRNGFPDEGMPAFGKDQIPESQMKDLILYIRSFTPTE